MCDNAFIASAANPEARKAAFIKEYPFYANWPYWDDYGLPDPDPAELAHFVGGGYDFDEDVEF